MQKGNGFVIFGVGAFEVSDGFFFDPSFQGSVTWFDGDCWIIWFDNDKGEFVCVGCVYIHELDFQLVDCATFACEADHMRVFLVVVVCVAA